MNTDKLYAESIAKEYAPKDKSKIIALRKLDAKAKLPATVFTYTLGILSALVFGTGMCLAMQVIGNSMVLGIIVGIIGMLGCGVNYPIYTKMLEKGKKKYAYEIVELAKEISEGKYTPREVVFMNKNESKYFNTAVKMDEALLTLLEKKDFEYITIKEICDTAGVNRSTFYLHYENTRDLLKEATRYIIDKHLGYYEVDQQRISLQFEACKREELLFITDKYLIPYLTFIKDNQRLFKVSVKQFHSMHMDEEVYDKMFQHIFSPILARFRIPEAERDYVMKFYLTGVFAIITEWLAKRCSDDMKTVIKVITDCVMGDRNFKE